MCLYRGGHLGLESPGEWWRVRGPIPDGRRWLESTVSSGARRHLGFEAPGGKERQQRGFKLGFEGTRGAMHLWGAVEGKTRERM